MPTSTGAAPIRLDGEIGRDLGGAGDESRLQEQIARRIAGQRHFRRDAQIDGARLADRGANQRRVAFEIANGGIELKQCDAHRTDWLHQSIKTRAMRRIAPRRGASL